MGGTNALEAAKKAAMASVPDPVPDPEAERDAARERLDLALAEADRYPRGEVAPAGHACRICGIAVPDGEGRTEGGPGKALYDNIPRGAHNVKIADGVQPRGGLPLRYSYDLPVWRVCDACSPARTKTRDDRAHAALLFALKIPTPWSSYADVVKAVAAEHGSIAYDETGSNDDTGHDRRFAHVGAGRLERLRIAFDKALDPRPERHHTGDPCSQCGQTHSRTWHTVGCVIRRGMVDEEVPLLVCGDCFEPSERATTEMARLDGTVQYTLADVSASRAAGVPLMPGLAGEVAFVTARQSPNYKTDDERGPWEYLDSQDRAALRKYALAKERRKRVPRREDGRLSVPVVDEESGDE